MGIKKKHVPGNACCGAGPCLWCNDDVTSYDVTITGLADVSSCCVNVNGTWNCPWLEYLGGACRYLYSSSLGCGSHSITIIVLIFEVDANTLEIRVDVKVYDQFGNRILWFAGAQLLSRPGANQPYDCSTINLTNLTQDTYAETGLNCDNAALTIDVAAA